MKVSSINNTNFNGRFKRTPQLESLLKCSDQNTLFRFNEVLERASKVNDRKVFKITEFSDATYNSWGKFSTYHFHLISHPEDNEHRTIIEDLKSFDYNHNMGKHVLLEKFSYVLKSFLPTLERIYPMVDYKDSKPELLEKINKQLI